MVKSKEPKIAIPTLSDKELTSMRKRASMWANRPMLAVEYFMKRQGVVFQILYRIVEDAAKTGDSSPATLKAIDMFTQLGTLFVEIGAGSAKEARDARKDPQGKRKVRPAPPVRGVLFAVTDSEGNAVPPGAGPGAGEAEVAGELGEKPDGLPDW